MEQGIRSNREMGYIGTRDVLVRAQLYPWEPRYLIMEHPCCLCYPGAQPWDCTKLFMGQVHTRHILV